MRPRWPFTVAHRAKDSLSLSPGYDMCCGVGSPAGSLFTPRENPRHLFIREAPPATSAVMPSSFVSSAGVPASKPISSSPCTPNLTIDMPETDKSADRQFSGESDGLGNILQIEDVHANGVSAADDEHVKDHLPVLRRDDYYMEPSMEVLAARAKGNPSTLKRVQGFTVGRHGFGHVKWLGVVDVTGLNLDSLVHIRYCCHACIMFYSFHGLDCMLKFFSMSLAQKSWRCILVMLINHQKERASTSPQGLHC